MEPKRELSSVDLAAVVYELGGYVGAKVDKVYRYGEDLLRFRMRDFDRGRVELLLEVGPVKRLHAADPTNVPEAPGRPPNFAKMLRNRLSGADFAGVDQHGFDRIIRLRFDRADESTTIVAELFGDGNVAVLDSTGEVVDCFETVRLKSRTVVPGSRYEYPRSRVNPLDLSFEAFAAHMDDSDTDVVRTLATQLNLGGLYAEELCSRAGVEKTLSITDAHTEDYEAVFEAIRALAGDLAAGRFEPRVYVDGEEVVDVAPVALVEYAEYRAEPFETFNAALDHYFSRLAAATAEADEQAPDEEIERQERIIEQQASAIERFAEEAETERARAERLYAEYDLVDEVISTVRQARQDGVPWAEIESRLETGSARGIPAAEAVVAVDEERGTVRVDLGGLEVDLDPRVGVEKNANRLYESAKRIEEKRDGAEEALAETRASLEAAHRRRETSESDASVADDDPADRAGDWLSRSSIPVTQPDLWYDRFRWFRTTDDFLVLGGRNAEQNEELVKKYLEPSDRFFHSQAHGAPVTILKGTDPNERARDVEFPAATLDQTAQFAVSYSSVWKDGRYAGDVYMVDPDQVSKTPESGEHLAKGAFVVRGDRTYFRDTAVGVAVGVQCAPETRVIGGPPAAIDARAATWLRVEPGGMARTDVATRIYRAFRDRFVDTAFVRRVASPEEIGRFLPPGGSRIVGDEG